MIEAIRLEKKYGEKTVLRVEKFFLERGETVSVLGPSGAGKSVFLRLLNLLEEPTAGKIFFRGREIGELGGKDRDRVRKKMTMLFQDPLLFKGKVLDNVVYGLKVRGVPPALRREKALGALRLVGLDGFEERRVENLSGGEAQRVALARAFVFEPEVLFLDEPFANLDALLKVRLQLDVKRILSEGGLSCVFVTHDQEEAARMGDRIVVLRQGRVLQEGTPEDVFSSPSSEFVARFTGMENILEGRVESVSEGICHVEVGGETIEVVGAARSGERVVVGIRPEEITLFTSLPRSSSRNVFEGKVAEIEILGPLAKVKVECPFILVSTITKKSLEELQLKEGMDVFASFKATAVHLFVAPIGDLREEMEY